MLLKPILAKCNNRNVVARVNNVCGEPDSWFDNDYLDTRDIKVLAFDFFVNWRQRNIPDEIWIKRIIDNRVNLSGITYNQFYNWICNIDGQENIQALLNFCQNKGISCHYFLFKDNVSWKRNPQSIYEVCLTSGSSNVLRPSDIQSRIENLRAEAVPIGPNGLFYGTSSLECYLSHTPFFWPGDVDALLIDNNNVLALVEYKKHNLNTPIQNQTLMNYRDRDRLKYQSLGLLREKFENQDCLPPLIMIFYPTGPRINQIKVEKVEGRYDNLTVTDQIVWGLPVRGDANSMRTFSQNLINFI